MLKDTQKKSTQLTANIGLYYVCYQLSRRGWNVMPTARNARGIDIVAYKGSGKDFIGIQVKTLSGRLAVPLNKAPEQGELPGDYWIIVTNVAAASNPPPPPDIFVMLPDEVKKKARRHPKSGSWGLVRDDYDSANYQDTWDRLQVREA